MARRPFDISPSTAFWAFVIVLLALAAYFTVAVEIRRHGWSGGPGSRATLTSGEVVEPIKVIDGDELSVRRGDDVFVVRLLGVKCFSGTFSDPAVQQLGAACTAALGDLARGGELRVSFGEFRRDRQGRVLGYLEVDGKDVGETLIRRGHALAYTAWPFGREPRYLVAEEEARTHARGLWGVRDVRGRIEALKSEWAQRREDRE